MINIIKWIVLTLYNILPDSPFRQMVEHLELQQDYLQYMNWFLPIDIIGNMMLAWLDCVLLYVLFHMISKLMSTIVTTIINGITSFLDIFI